MSGHRIIVMLILFVSLELTAKSLISVNDDPQIIQGLVFEEYGIYDEARMIYAKLFDKTGEKEYLFREATVSILGNVGIGSSILRLNAWDHDHPHEIGVYRLLIPLYLSSSQFNRARVKAESLLEYSNDTKDLELAMRPFLYLGEYEKVLSLLNKVYQQSFRESVLLRMVTIMDLYTNERKSALQLLEMHRRMSTVSRALWEKMIALYTKENDFVNLHETYKAYYKESKDKKVLNIIINNYLEKEDALGAITFLEEQKIKNILLFELYRKKQLFSKAFHLAQYHYKETKEVRWLAESAIMLFEKSEDKHNKVMITKVMGMFDKAVSLGVDDSIYLNYYGYILIDYEIDIDKGIEIIKDALVQQPDNTYYLDSLAWGYQKKKKCKKAYRLMKRVVEEEGLKIDEIKRHWQAIKVCR